MSYSWISCRLYLSYVVLKFYSLHGSYRVSQKCREDAITWSNDENFQRLLRGAVDLDSVKISSWSTWAFVLEFFVVYRDPTGFHKVPRGCNNFWTIIEIFKDHSGVLQIPVEKFVEMSCRTQTFLAFSGNPTGFPKSLEKVQKLANITWDAANPDSLKVSSLSKCAVVL